MKIYRKEKKQNEKIGMKRGTEESRNKNNCSHNVVDTHNDKQKQCKLINI